MDNNNNNVTEPTFTGCVEVLNSFLNGIYAYYIRKQINQNTLQKNQALRLMEHSVDFYIILNYFAVILY